MNDCELRPVIPEDRAIIEHFRTGDPRAAAEAEQKYGNLLRGIANGLLGDEQACEECLNDLWYALYTELPAKAEVSFRAYAAKVMRNIAISRYYADNRKKRKPDSHLLCLEELAEVIPAGKTAEEEFFDSELARLINEFIAGLDEKGRFIFLCRYYESKTVEQTALEAGVHVASVYRTLAKQRKKLKEMLERSGYEL